MKNSKKIPNSNPVAKALRTGRFRPLVINSKKKYNRKNKGLLK